VTSFRTGRIDAATVGFPIQQFIILPRMRRQKQMVPSLYNSLLCGGGKPESLKLGYMLALITGMIY
jgi:hypothetical protein